MQQEQGLQQSKEKNACFILYSSIEYRSLSPCVTGGQVFGQALYMHRFQSLICQSLSFICKNIEKILKENTEGGGLDSPNCFNVAISLYLSISSHKRRSQCPCLSHDHTVCGIFVKLTRHSTKTLLSNGTNVTCSIWLAI